MVVGGKFKEKKLKAWISTSVLSLNETGITQDIHVDELLDEFDKFNNEQTFSQSCSLFKYLVDHLITSKINTLGISVFLSIDLISQSNSFIGKPGSLGEVETLIDTYSIPEIIVYKDLNPNEVPLTEFYRVPILNDYFSKSTPISIFYKEFRAFEDIVNNGEFTRTIDIYYMQSS